jgi:hypothetical protein
MRPAPPTPPAGSLRDHDALVAALAAHRLLEAAFDCEPTLQNAAYAEEAYDRLRAAARRCGMVACRRDVAGWAERRAELYGRMLLRGGRP